MDGECRLETTARTVDCGVGGFKLRRRGLVGRQDLPASGSSQRCFNDIVLGACP